MSDNGGRQIFLLQLPAWGRQSPPFASALLAAVLRRAGFSVRCLDLNNDLYHHVPAGRKTLWSEVQYDFWTNPPRVRALVDEYRDYLETVARSLISSDPLFVGMSVNAKAALFTLEFAAMLKRLGLRAPVVCGGPYWVREQRDALERPLLDGLVDAVAVGEGEGTIVDLAASLQSGTGIAGIKGLYSCLRGRVVCGGERDPLPEVDSLPYPDYSDFDLSRYQDPQRIEVFGTRGCVNHCLFCNEREQWKQFRAFSGERLFAEVRSQLARYPQVNKVIFNDSCFNGAIGEFEKFCDLVIAAGLKFSWAAQGRLHPQMTEERIRKMKQSGCEYLSLGLESASQQVLDSMHKYQDVGQCERIIRWVHDAGIKAYVNFMFGFPGETARDARLSREFLKRNAVYIDGVSPSWSLFAIRRSAGIWSELDAFHIAPEPHELFWEDTSGRNTYPVRFARYEAFCREAMRCGIKGTGVVACRGDKWRMAGHYYAYKHDWLRAIVAYTRSLGYESRARDIVCSLRTCYERTDNAAAVRECDYELEAFDRHPSESEGLLGGLQAFNNGDFRTALDGFMRSLAITPWSGPLARSSVARYAGECCLHTQQYRQARHFLEQAGYRHVLCSDDKALFDCATACWHLQDVPAAEVFFRRAVRSYPRYRQAQYYLGLCLVRLHRVREALRHLEAAFWMDPGDLDVIGALMRAGFDVLPAGRLQALIMTHLRVRPESQSQVLAWLQGLRRHVQACPAAQTS